MSANGSSTHQDSRSPQKAGVGSIKSVEKTTRYEVSHYSASSEGANFLLVEGRSMEVGMLVFAPFAKIYQMHKLSKLPVVLAGTITDFGKEISGSRRIK